MADWAIILAGGRGKRMRRAIQRKFGVHIPKQYCTFSGKRTMLEHTIDRAQELVDPERIVTVIQTGHSCFFEEEKLRGKIIEQPVSRDTAPGVFLPASYIRARDPEALIYVFPSDHFIYPEEQFIDQMRRAATIARSFREYIVLMGIEADRPEPDYGWIEPGEELQGWTWGGKQTVRKITGFQEKPSRRQAEKWFDAGYFWNAMILVCQMRTLWKLGDEIIPFVTRRFDSFLENLPADQLLDKEAPRQLVELYDELPSVNLSGTFLRQAAERMLVMPLVDIVWNDWGRPERITESLHRIGKKSLLEEAAAVSG